MNISIHPTLSNGRHAMSSLRSHAEKAAERGLSASSAVMATAEQASHRAAKLLSRGAKDISQAVREHVPARASGLASIPAVRQAARAARRHPALLVAAGVTAAAVGYATWRLMRDTAAHDIEHEVD